MKKKEPDGETSGSLIYGSDGHEFTIKLIQMIETDGKNIRFYEYTELIAINSP